MTRHIIDIDLDSCIGCHSCAVVCKQENNVGLGTFYNKVLTVGLRELSRPGDVLPAVSCQHCDNPECVSVCPTGASYKRDDGVVLVDHSKCIGCQYCLYGCPYGVRQMDEEHGVPRSARYARRSPPTAAMCPPACTTATAAPASSAITTTPKATCAGKWRSTPKSAFTPFPTRAMPSRLPATSCPRSSPVGRS